jgi:hypothetical protein
MRFTGCQIFRRTAGARDPQPGQDGSAQLHRQGALPSEQGQMHAIRLDVEACIPYTRQVRQLGFG